MAFKYGKKKRSNPASQSAISAKIRKVHAEDEAAGDKLTHRQEVGKAFGILRHKTKKGK